MPVRVIIGGTLILSFSFHLIENCGRQILNKNPHHHWAFVRKLWLDMASKTIDQKSSLSFLTAVRKTYLHIKNWNFEGVWFVSVMGGLWEIGKLIDFPPAFNREIILCFFWVIFPSIYDKNRFCNTHFYTGISLINNSTFFFMELCTSTSVIGVVIMPQNFHLIDNHGKQPPYKHPHHHRAAVRTHWFGMASKISYQNSSLYVLTAVIKNHLHIKNWKIEGVWFVSVMGDLWRKKCKINTFPTRFQSRIKILVSLGQFLSRLCSTHLYTSIS